MLHGSWVLKKPQKQFNMFINLFGLTLWGQWRVGEMGKKTKLILKIWVFGENVELGFYKNLTWVFFSSFAVLVWTVWHHRHRRSGFALPVCYLKTELIFPLLVAFCRLSSLPLVGLTSRSWMCWMKIAGDWPSLTLANFSALFFGSFLVDCGVFLLCLHLCLFLRCNDLKSLLCFLLIWNYCPKFTFQKILLASLQLRYSRRGWDTVSNYRYTGNILIFLPQDLAELF